jgi:hypothetical protein
MTRQFRKLAVQSTSKIPAAATALAHEAKLALVHTC